MISSPTQKEQVYQRIRRAVITGELKAGEILNEAEIARQFEAGKTPTREALILLAHEGLVESLPRVGYLVTRPTLQDVLEAFHLRLILEVEAIGLAAERISEENLGALQKNNAQEADLLASLPDERLQKEKAYELNRDFHLIIARASGNVRLARYIEELVDDMERMLVSDPYLAEPSQHKEILAGLARRDKTHAQAAMRFHIEETRNRIVNRF